MTGQEFVSLADIVAIGGESIDPQKYASEVFHLFSIPAYDANRMPETIHGSDIGSVKRTILPGDCLFSKLNPRINRVWVVPSELGYRQIATPEFWPLRVKPQIDLSPFYLAHLLSWQTFRNEVIGREEAATKSRSRLKPEQLLSKTIPLPPLDEQHRIVRILDEADALRQLRARADERMAEFIPALFNQMFGDPATNPKGWPTMQLSDAGTLDRGKSRHRPRDEASLYGGSYPFIQTGDIANSGGQITTYLQTYSELGLAQSRMWPADTLCITIAANIAKTAILTFPACFPDSVVGFIPGNGMQVDFVRQWFVTVENRLEELAPQAAQKNINLKILNELTIPVPPLSLQRDFAARVAEARALQDQQAQSRSRLEAGFQALLYRAFAGEL